jgi:ABC-type Fe3+-hydroxamate transport system substrate-binding protein
MFGTIFGRLAEAEALAACYAAAREALLDAVSTVPHENVLYLIWRKPWYTVARSTYVSAVLALARWRTVPAISAPRYPTLDDNAPAWREAERILLSTEPYAFKAKDASALALMLASRGQPMPVALIDGEMTSWYGARAIAGLGYLAKMRRDLAGS